MIGTTRVRSGLYYFDKDISPNKQATSVCCYAPVSSNQEIMLWHRRLGHLSFSYMKYLFPSLFLNKSPIEFQCEVC